MKTKIQGNNEAQLAHHIACALPNDENARGRKHVLTCLGGWMEASTEGDNDVTFYRIQIPK